MRAALLGVLLLVLGVGASAPARAQGSQWCTQWDSHGRCLVCEWSYEGLTLHPGEIVQPFNCADMARDPRAVLVFGGTGTVEGPPGPWSHIGLRIWRDGHAYSGHWGPNVGTMPVGPVSIPIGRTGEGAFVAPYVRLTACGVGRWPAAACHLTLSGRVCLSGMC